MMIEKIIYEYLKSVLGVPVYVEVPADAPAEYVAIQKTGSQTENGIETAKVAVQSCSDTLFKAADLNEQVKVTMSNIIYSDPNVFSCLIDSDYNWTNTNTKTRRYQATFDITFK